MVKNKSLRWVKPSLAKLVGSYVLFPLGAAIILAIIWLGIARMLTVEENAADKRAAQSSLELLETYEAQLIRALSILDQSLKTVEYAKAFSLNSSVLDPLYDKRVLPPALLFTVGIIDQYGQVTESTDGTYPFLGGEPFYLHHAKTSDGLLAVTLLPGNPEDGEDKLVFSRRINTPDGSFGGVATIKVGVDYFISGYEPARLGSKGLLGLIDDKGMFLIKRTGDDVSSGLRAGAEFLQATASESALVVSPWDGVARYTNTRSLFGYPMKITVGLSRAEQLEGFAEQKRTLLWGALLGTLALAIITAIFTRLARQLEKNRARTRRDQETYYAASEASMDVVIVLHAVLDKNHALLDFRIESANKRARHLLNTSCESLIGADLSILAPQVRSTALYRDITQTFLDREVREAEWENDCDILLAKWLYRQVVRIDDGVVLVLRDITERKEVEERITHLAHHDALTGLPNRAMLDDRLKQAILSAEKWGKTIAVAFMDLDNFKIVNDGLGHKAGDEILKVVATRISENLRQSDTVVRLGGDEFVILMPDQAKDGAAKTILKVCEAISRPARILGHSIEVSTSIGISMYPSDGLDSETLLLNADMAMYEAKQNGRNNYQFYTAGMSAQIAGKLVMQEDMRHALERKEFHLLYQPQVNIETREIVGVEALVRWRHPQKGIIPPNDFISLAEETGLIVPLGDWVMREACRQNRAWQEMGFSPITMSVNVSTYQFREGSLSWKVEQILNETTLAPCYLDLELTESLIMQDSDRAAQIMQQLKQLGVKLSIDDFGTGYSSLAYLQTFPIFRLKLDRSFVNNLSQHQGGRAIAKSVAALGHELEMEVLAEGVESEGQRLALQSMGFDLAQGYLFGRPVPANEIEQLLGKRERQAQEVYLQQEFPV